MVMTKQNRKQCGRPKMRLMTLLAIVSVSSWLFTENSLADLQNGDFSSPLDVGWTNYDVVSIDSGVAAMGEDQVAAAYLEQEFTIPAGSASLSFEYRPLFEVDGEESFSASLLDPMFFMPLIPTGETYYFLHDWDYPTDTILRNPAYVTLVDIGGGWSRVTLNLMDLGGVAADALLAFDFIPGFGDASLAGEIRLDNVVITAVPVPPAVVLAFLGLGAAYSRLRRQS